MTDAVHYFYNTEPQVYWGILVALYFLYAGVSAGSFFISSLGSVFNVEKFKPFSKLSAIMALVFVIAAPIHLIADLEQPARFLYLFIHPHFTSAISWGVFLLTFYALVTLAYTWHLIKGDVEQVETKVRRLGMLGLALAVLVEGYTGMILASVQARAIWHSALMPFFFAVSALVSATAVLIIIYWFFRKGSAYEGNCLNSLLIGFLVTDLAMVFVMTLVLWKGNAPNHAAAYVMLFGSEKIAFLFVEILLGLITPIVILAKWGRTYNAAPALASVLTLIGVVATRFNIVILGQRIPLTGDRLLSYHLTSGEIVTAGIIGVLTVGALVVFAQKLTSSGSIGRGTTYPSKMTMKEGV